MCKQVLCPAFRNVDLLIYPLPVWREMHRRRIRKWLRLILRCLECGEEIFKAVLHADVVGFHAFDHARHFLNGLNHESLLGRKTGLVTMLRDYPVCAGKRKLYWFKNSMRQEKKREIWSTYCFIDYEEINGSSLYWKEAVIVEGWWCLGKSLIEGLNLRQKETITPWRRDLFRLLYCYNGIWHQNVYDLPP